MSAVIRKGTLADVDAAEAIYNEIFDAENRAGKSWTCWKRGEYPTRSTAEESVKAGTFYVYEEDGQILASMRMNHEQPDAYQYGHWTIPAREDEVVVIHTLTVSPRAQGKGIGPAMIKWGCDYAKQHGCKVFRFDTNALNKPAADLYERLGYPLVGVVETLFEGCIPCHLNLYEKAL